MGLEFLVEENGSLDNAAAYISKAAELKPIVLFTGDLGTGKTTLIKKIGERLGLDNQMNSPSFGIINAYNSEDGKTFYHIDLYRLNKPEEAYDIGLMEILDSGDTCWIEWPEILNDIWQSYDVLRVDISLEKKGQRCIFVIE